MPDSIYSKPNIGEKSLTDILGALNVLNEELDRSEAGEEQCEDSRARIRELHNKILTVGMELQPYTYCLTRF